MKAVEKTIRKDRKGKGANIQKRQKDGQTERLTGSQTYRQTDRKTDRQTDRQTDSQKDINKK